MRSPWFSIFPVFLLIVHSMQLIGCARHSVRHLASDVSLLTPGNTTKEEVVALLGVPNDKKENASEGETWIYFEQRKSFMAGLPVVGNKLGSSEYDVVTITFSDEVVKTGTYRILGEKEFQEAGIRAGENVE